MDSEFPTRDFIDRFQRGDRVSFNGLIERYWGRVLLMVELNMPAALRPFLDPDDVAQEIWILVYRGLSGFEYRGDGSFHAWLGVVVRNCFSTLLTQAQALKRQPGEGRKLLREAQTTDAPPFLLQQIAAEQTSPSSAAVRSESFQRLREAIRALPARERQVVSLRYLEERTVSATAAELGVSEAAVKMASLRGLRSLGDVLAEIDL